MIYTITVNPALDYVLSFDEIKEGRINHPADAAFYAGGKGINVSQILDALKTKNTAWGFAGGFTGQELVRQLNQKHVGHDLVTIAGNTRVNVKVRGRKETEFNAAGPKVTQQEIHAFKMRLEDLKQGDLVTISGSLLPNLPRDFYITLLPAIKQAGARFAIDCTGDQLLDSLHFHPLVIKPNQEELAELTGDQLEGGQDIIAAGQKLQKQGAENVMISLNKNGGILVTKDHVYQADAANGDLVNSVGAGDSMLAGFIAESVRCKSAKDSFRMGMACGAATAFSSGLAIRSQIEVIYPQIKVRQLA